MSRLTSDDVDRVRDVVLCCLETGEPLATFSQLADKAGVSTGLLSDRFGRLERLVDEVVAGVLRRARPRVDFTDDAADLLTQLTELIGRRLNVVEQISTVWRHIGQGEASTQEFDALRSVLVADARICLDRHLLRLNTAERIEAVQALDVALDLSVLRDLLQRRSLSSTEATTTLAAQLNRLNWLPTMTR